MPRTDPSFRHHRVLLTRQSGFNTGLVAELETRGARTAEVPVLSVSPTPDAGPNSESGKPAVTDIIFVSQNAVIHGLSRIKRLSGFDDARVLAVGSATAEALHRDGIACISPEHASGSEALMALPGLSDWSGRSVVIIRGVSGREWLREELERRGASVEYLPAYLPATPDAGAARLASAVREFEPNVIFVHSRAGLESLLSMSAEAGLTLLDKLLVVGAAAIGDAAKVAGWRADVRVAQSPGDADMVAALGHHVSPDCATTGS